MTVAQIVAAAAQTPAPKAQTPAPKPQASAPKAPAAAPKASPQKDEQSTAMLATVGEEWKGDLDGMIKRRRIRILVPYSKTSYFIDKGIQRGIVYDAGLKVEEQLNLKLK